MTAIIALADRAPGGSSRPGSQHLAKSLNLSSADADVLDGALRGADQVKRGQVLGSAKHAPAFFILSGWAALQRTAASGARQIVAFFLPGDFVGLDTATAPMPDGEIIALTAMKVRHLSPEGRAVLSTTAGLVRAIASQNLQHQARLQDQILRLGAMTALERTAHLLAELGGRLERSATRAGPQEFPVKQEVLAQALGLSLVHVSRTLKRLRELKLAWFERGALVTAAREALLSVTDMRLNKAC